MKKFIITLASGFAVVSVMSVLVSQRDVIFDNSYEVINVPIEKGEIEEVVVPVDVIEQSKVEMERISLELDEEETKLLEEKAALKLEYDAKQNELDTKLEAITEIRLSF